jgi:hypothetical protein
MSDSLPTETLALKACRLLLEDGVECECGDIDICARCAAQAAVAQDNYEPPDPDGECYRGGEAASALAEEQARIQRDLK